MQTKKVIIISPSGNLYGSEQVLLDFLKTTSLDYELYVPENSLFSLELNKHSAIKARIRFFQHKGLTALYFKLTWRLLTGKYKSLYLNEAAHVKYILLLSKVFSGIKFVVHVRIIEDTKADRWIFRPPANLFILSISRFIHELLPFNNHMLYDPYSFSSRLNKRDNDATKDKLVVGIIGRITESKGILLLPGLLQYIEAKGEANKYRFRLFGDISLDMVDSPGLKMIQASPLVELMGFQAERDKMYSRVDCIMHLNSLEPLGRIFLEAIDECLPFIGLNGGGIGEMVNLLQMDDFLVDSSSPDINAALFHKLQDTLENFTARKDKVIAKRNLAKEVFNTTKYTTALDKILLT